MDPIVSQTARRQSQQQNQTPQQQQQQPDSESSPKSNGKSNSKSSNKLSNGNKMKKSPSFSSTQLSASVSSEKISGLHNTTENSDRKTISQDDQALNLSSLPEMSPYERYICSLAHMNEILLRNKTLNDDVSAQETCAILIEHVMRLTANKREILEKGLVEASTLPTEKERMEYQSGLRERVQKLRGKLDHASICAYEVGTFK